MSDYYPPIGILRTPFTEKFGVPRQSLMIREARGVLKLNPDPGYRIALKHLEKFSHVWVIFAFHRRSGTSWRPTISPPRVDAPKRVGVFASRSPHRPNPIGMSALKLERIDLDAPGGIEIHLSGVDILDETPVLDIKPYLPFADRIDDATSGWAGSEISRYSVHFSDESRETLSSVADAHPDLMTLIQRMLEWDPRPTSQRRSMPIEAPETEGMIFGFRIFEFDVHWQVRGGGIFVLKLVKAFP